MSTMISEVYDAFRSAGVPEDKARAPAEALSEDQLATKADIVKLGKELLVIKWMLGLVVVVIPLIKPFFS
ncbi:hypothetical protein [Methylocapsa aurea]|uniref:hypothetical protein n=1 Tax=Methylocapsa aurea TaxID=663610 RepID=UPI0005615815|nr:hypothetical protein [Methylocapsa aurea]